MEFPSLDAILNHRGLFAFPAIAFAYMYVESRATIFLNLLLISVAFYAVYLAIVDRESYSISQRRHLSGSGERALPSIPKVVCSAVLSASYFVGMLSLWTSFWQSVYGQVLLLLGAAIAVYALAFLILSRNDPRLATFVRWLLHGKG